MKRRIFQSLSFLSCLMLLAGFNRMMAQTGQDPQTEHGNTAVTTIVMTLICEDGRRLISRDGGQTWQTIESATGAEGGIAPAGGANAIQGRGACIAAPNPATSFTAISYTVKQPGEVSLAVYDMSGVEIKRLSQGAQQSGLHVTTVDVSNLHDGTYYYRIATDGSAVGGGILIVAH